MPAGLTADRILTIQQATSSKVHEEAYDFTRFTLGGHRWLFRAFRESDAGLVLGPGIALLWSISNFVKALGGSRRLAALVTALFFWVRFLDKWAKRGPALDAASGLYFLGTKSDDLLNPNQLPEYYRQHR